VDTTGTVQERYGYNGFGGVRYMDANFVTIPASAFDWETLFDSYRYDTESGLYQARYRYLHPLLGRWITRDPIGEPGFELLRANFTPLFNGQLRRYRPNRDPIIEQLISKNRNSKSTNGLFFEFNGSVDWQNLYRFAQNNPVNLQDRFGLTSLLYFYECLDAPISVKLKCSCICAPLMSDTCETDCEACYGAGSKEDVNPKQACICALQLSGASKAAAEKKCKDLPDCSIPLPKKK